MPPCASQTPIILPGCIVYARGVARSEMPPNARVPPPSAPLSEAEGRCGRRSAIPRTRRIYGVSGYAASAPLSGGKGGCLVLAPAPPAPGFWIPASAGMTGWEGGVTLTVISAPAECRHGGRPSGNPGHRLKLSFPRKRESTPRATRLLKQARQAHRSAPALPVSAGIHNDFLIRGTGPGGREGALSVLRDLLVDCLDRLQKVREVIQGNHVRAVARGAVGIFMTLDEEGVDADGRGRPGQIGDELPVSARCVSLPPRKLDAVGDVKHHRPAGAPEDDERPHIRDQVVVAEGGSPLGQEDPLRPGRLQLLDDVMKVPGREELPFLR